MIGVVGDDETATRVVDAIRDAGVAVEVGRAGRVVDAGPTVAVAAGEAALGALVEAGVGVPVLVVGDDAGPASVPVDRAVAAVDRLATGDFETRDHRLLGVRTEGEAVGPAALDVTLVRAEPGRISEYAVAAGETRSRFRADGVVVATPLGSHGYAHAAGGPRLSLDATAVAVVPVAAFGLGAPTWVVGPDDGLRLSVERDEGEVSLLVDGTERRRLAGRSAVDLTPGGTLETVALDDG